MCRLGFDEWRLHLADENVMSGFRYPCQRPQAKMYTLLMSTEQERHELSSQHLST
jgi:hypothetical protein